MIFKNPNGVWWSLFIDSPKSESWFTPWSFIHFLNGFILALILSFFKFHTKSIILLSFLIHTIYELKDYHFAYNTESRKLFKFNSVRNSLGDTISFMLGIVFPLYFTNLLNPFYFQLSLTTLIIYIIFISMYSLK